MKKTFLILFICLLAMLVGCTNGTEGNNPPQIAPMELSSSQQEIVNLITHRNQEILLFDYMLDGIFNEMEIWVEVYNYGERIGEISALRMFGDQTVPLDNGRLVIQINQYNNDFIWTFSAAGGRVTSPSWTMDSDIMARSFGAVTESVSIVDGKEIVLYMSVFTTGSTIRSRNDLQHYLEHMGELSGYTYVHIIKARFSK